MKTIISTFILVIISSLLYSQNYITLGSNKSLVLKIQGKPDKVNSYTSLGYEVWKYEYSDIKISAVNGSVTEWDNDGNLRVKLIPGNNTTTLSYFTRDSHKDDVIRLQGTPDQISKYSSLGYEVWKYGYSDIKISTSNGKVLEWDNDGNLKAKLNAGNNTTTLSYFTRGSHKDDVIRLQGTPDQISKYSSLGYEVWKYGYSDIKISTSNGKVLEWDNDGNLKAKLNAGNNTTTLSYFTRGSHKDDVIRLQGTPDQISKYSSLGYEVWKYGYSDIKISTSNGKVLEWDNDGNLKAKLNAGNNTTTLSYFTRGSHKDDVIRLQGTPDQISKYSSLGYEVWKYGYSDIKISLYSSKVIAYDNESNLKTKNSYGKEKIKYHHSFGDVTLYYSENKSFSGILEFESKNGNSYYGFIEDGVCFYYDDDWNPINIYSYATKDKRIITKPYGENYNDSYFQDISITVQDYSFDNSININGTIQRIGQMTFYDLYSDYGNSIHGTSIDFGIIEFDDFYTNAGYTISGSRIEIGDFEFGDWYGSDGTTISGSTYQIGNIQFHDYYSNDGSSISGTTIEIGDFSFTDYYEW